MKRHHILILAASLVVAPGIALASACQSGVSLQTILTTNSGICSIDGITFDFTGYSAVGANYNSSGTEVGDGNESEYAATAVIFSTTADGFNLAGTFSSSSSLESYGEGALSYTIVSVSGGTLTGETTDINGASTSASVGSSGTSEGVVGSLNFNSGGNDGIAYDESSTSQTSGSSSSSTTYSYANTFAAETSTSGVAYILTDASTVNGSGNCCGNGGTASASFKSADFNFQVASTPEPSAWLSLLATGLLAIVPLRRLRHRG